MSNRPPEFCPYCGTELAAVEPPLSHWCESCGQHVFHNPTPAARVAVLDGDRILLVKVDLEDRDLWGTPGGMVEPGEDPQETAARELAEETGLRVDPADLVLFDARTFVKFEAVDKLSLSFAVDEARTSGTLAAGDEPAEARFWSAETFRAADDRLLTSWPAAHRNLDWWFEHAGAALDDGP